MGFPDNDDDDNEFENDECNQHSSCSYNYKVCRVNKTRNGGRIGVSHREDGDTLFHTGSKASKTSEK